MLKLLIAKADFTDYIGADLSFEKSATIEETFSKGNYIAFIELGRNND